MEEKALMSVALEFPRQAACMTQCKPAWEGRQLSVSSLQMTPQEIDAPLARERGGKARVRKYVLIAHGIHSKWLWREISGQDLRESCVLPAMLTGYSDTSVSCTKDLQKPLRAS